MREVLGEAGYEPIAPNKRADVYVINTCTVTSISDRKSRQMIRKAIALNPSAIVVVTGCYAERSPEEVGSIRGVDLVLPNSEKPFILEYLDGASGWRRVGSDRDWASHPCVTKFDGQTRALVKIEDGCDNFCTYCIIPYVRGGSIRSRPIDSILHEVRSLAKNGHKEVVLTGIHLGAYGRDLVDNIRLSDVLRAIHAVDGIERIRLSSVEPMDISDELIHEISRLPKCAHHLHISLQSGSDRILQLMNRGYTSSEFLGVTNKISSAIPDIGISTDVMVGFPGETDSDFADTCALVEKVRFSRLHVFRYSPRKGTPAEKFPGRVPDSVSIERSQKLISLGKRLAQEFHSRMLGQKAEVLVEGIKHARGLESHSYSADIDGFVPQEDNGPLSGFTSNYVKVLLPNETSESLGQLIKVKLIDMKDDYMIGLRDSGD